MGEKSECIPRMKFLIHVWQSLGGKKLSSALRAAANRGEIDRQPRGSRLGDQPAAPAVIKGHSIARLRAIRRVSVWPVESQSIVESYPFLAGLRFPIQIGQGE
jgi:hypothetical protein